MRNTHQYPITKAEKLAVIDRCAELLEQDVGGRFGDVGPMALRLVREDIMKLPDE